MIKSLRSNSYCYKKAQWTFYTIKWHECIGYILTENGLETDRLHKNLQKESKALTVLKPCALMDPLKQGQNLSSSLF